MARTQDCGFDWLDEDQEEADRQTASLAGLAVAIFLVVISLYVVHQLALKTALEDCLLSGRTNCDLIISHLH